MFVWHFTPTHSSSETFATGTGSALHAPLRALQPGHGWLTRFQVYHQRQNALFTLGFPRAPAVTALTGPLMVTRRVILQKARDHRVSEDTYGSHCMDAVGFRLCFTPLAGVLFTVPSRYCALSVTTSSQPWAVVDPASHAISRVAWYSSLGIRYRCRALRDSHPLWCGVPATLCTSIDARWSSCRTTHAGSQPPFRNACRLDTERVLADPISLATTLGLISLPRGT